MGIKGLSDFGLSSGGAKIKSHQRGKALLNTDHTGIDTTQIPINQVDISKSICRVIFKENVAWDVTTPREVFVSSYFLNSSTLGIIRGYGTSSRPLDVYWEVIEFEKVKNLQRGGIGEGANISINPVNIDKSLLVLDYYHTSTSGGVGINNFSTIEFIDSSTLNIRGISPNYHRWQLVEFD